MNKDRQEKVEKHLDAEKLSELEQMRSRFFTNVSHEFRTPLFLILVPLETLLESAAPESKEYLLYLMMQRNARRLLNLTN